jgi:hypothetical protein
MVMLLLLLLLLMMMMMMTEEEPPLALLVQILPTNHTGSLSWSLRIACSSSCASHRCKDKAWPPVPVVLANLMQPAQVMQDPSLNLWKMPSRLVWGSAISLADTQESLRVSMV